MNSKRKVIVAMSAFAMLLLATVVAVVAVLAAQNVTVTSQIRVSYTSNQKAAVVTAKYQISGGTAANLGSGSITFDGTEASANATKSLTTSEVSITGLDSSNKYVDFIFTFTNPGSADYTATLTLPTTNTNFTVSYTKATGTGVSSATDTSFKLAGGTTSPVTYKVRYTIADVSKDATLSGLFSWSLT